MSGLQVGAMVSVPLAGGITSNGALCCAGFSFDIIGETAKAWKVQAETETGKEITAWLPKSALTKPTDRGNWGNQPVYTCGLARWFNPTGWTATFISLATSNSTLRGVA